MEYLHKIKIVYLKTGNQILVRCLSLGFKFQDYTAI